MAHEFETGFSVGEAMWHKHSASVVLPNAPSLDEALQIAGIDWEVESRPMFYKSTSDEMVEVPDRVANVRISDDRFLGNVSPKYKISQNKANLEGFRPLVENGELTLETAGSLREGKRCWILGRYGKNEEVTDGDEIAPYLLNAWGHDGLMGIRIINTPIRVVCMNTMRASGANSGDISESFQDPNNITISHMGDVDAKVKAAIQAVVIARAQFKNTMDVYRAMAGKPVDVQTVKNFAREIFDKDYTKAVELIKSLRQREKTEEIVRSREFQAKITELENFVNDRSEHSTVNAIVESFEAGPGHEMAGSTVWGMVNACTDYIDHKRSSTPDKAMNSSWFGAGVKDRALVFESAEALL